MNLSQNYIQELILEGEGAHLDFKYHVADSAKIAKTLVAFANTGGGRLLLGVKDNGKIIGVQSDEELYMIETSQMFCDPKVDYSIKEWEVENKIVLEVIVNESSTKPHYVKDEKGIWRVYVRIKDKNRNANRVVVEVLKRYGRKKQTVIYYAREEKLLLSHLGSVKYITIEEFMELAHIKKRKAENILINLISVGVLWIGYNGKKFVYALNENHFEEEGIFTFPVINAI